MRIHYKIREANSTFFEASFKKYEYKEKIVNLSISTHLPTNIIRKISCQY